MNPFLFILTTYKYPFMSKLNNPIDENNLSIKILNDRRFYTKIHNRIDFINEVHMGDIIILLEDNDFNFGIARVISINLCNSFVILHMLKNTEDFYQPYYNNYEIYKLFNCKHNITIFKYL